MSNKINIVYAINDLYAPAAAASVLSVWCNTEHKDLCSFYLFYFHLSDDTRDKLEEMARRYNIEIKFTEVDDQRLQNLTQVKYLTCEMYLRLAIGELLTGEDKALYLDADTIVTGDISQIYSVDLSGNVIGAIKDMPNIYRAREVKQMGLDPDTYFNSGVLLFDLNLFRQGYYEKAIATIRDNELKYPDQDALNICCGGKVKYIDMRWNFQWGHYLDNFRYIGSKDLDQYKAVMNDFSIIHYTSARKPWNSFSGKKLSCYFYQYASQTPFWEDVQDYLVRSVSTNEITSNVSEIVADKFRCGSLGFSNICTYAKEWLRYKLKKGSK